MGMFDEVIWGADNVCVHCGKKIKIWQGYIRPSTYVIHEKCFDEHMKQMEQGIPRKLSATERAAAEVMGRSKPTRKKRK